MQDYTDIWNSILDEMRGHVSITAMNLWLEDLKLGFLSDTTAVLIAKKDFKRDVITKNYRDKIKQYVREVLGYDVAVTVLSEEHGPVDLTPYEEREVFIRTAIKGEEPESDPAKSEDDGEPDYYAPPAEDVLDPASYRPNRKYTFDNFLVGSSNKFAHAAALAVANNVAEADSADEYNPLFIYGASGLGKTHLLYAITNRVLDLNPSTRIVYAKGDEFLNLLVKAISTRTNAAFREKFREVDLLLIDDIQFIAGKEGAQEEFFNTFNALYDAGKQIIVTSDRPPREIKRLEDRLLTRFEWGVQADIQKPNYELRCAIARKKAQMMDFDCPDSVIAMICESLTDNVRQIEGALRNLYMRSKLENVSVTVENAREWLSDMLAPAQNADISPEQVIRIVSQKYGIPVSDIKSRKRSADIAAARHKCVYLINKLTGMTPSRIGEKVFSRDHTTMANSIRNIEFEIENDAAFEEEIHRLIDEINRG
ncbi:MAG: chromosomal replication initiator protein DnaA [Clostridia bacterium]|nr:chromosomal replication initiator protein DnaA [Clostridia bacterium]